MTRAAVIGAGVAGLTAAYRLACAGHDVTVHEREDRPGGLASSFSCGGVEVDRNFHFLCAGDAAFLDLMGELGLGDRVGWSRTRMGYFRNGRRHDFGTPLSLLAFRALPLTDRIRFGMSVLGSRGTRPGGGDAPDGLDGISAREWVESTPGHASYDVVWRPLLQMKFGQRADDVSAAWLRERIRRLATSRTGPLLTERLGYVSGGTRIVVDRLVEAIEGRGGQCRLGSRVDEVIAHNGRVTGVRLGDRVEAADVVVSSVATPLFLAMAPDLTGPERDRLASVDYLGVVTWSVLATRPLTGDFWLNVDDQRVPFPGVITYTLLDPMPGLGAHLHYIPAYMRADDPRWDADEGAERERLLAGLDVVSPGFSQEVIDVRRSRDRWAQPVFDVGFGARLGSAMSPATPVRGLLRCDMAQTYPHDRSLVNAVAKGSEAAKAALSSLYTGHGE